MLWAGLLLQKPYRAIHEMGVPLLGVYCSYYLYGSPAHFYNLKACRYIVEVNGQSVVDGLDAFLAVVKPLGDDAPVRLKTVDLQEQAIAYTLKTDYLFWPTRELKLDNTQDGRQLMLAHKPPTEPTGRARARAPGVAAAVLSWASRTGPVLRGGLHV